MVDRARAELDGERDRPHLGELVAVDAQLEPRRTTGDQIPARLLDVERPPLDEHVGGDGDARRLWQHLLDHPVDVRVGIRMLGRNGVRAEPGRHAAGRANGFELGELGVVVEPVAALPLERRRAVREHRVAVANDGLARARPARRAGGAHRREDPAPRGEQLLVRRPRRTERELVRTVAHERRMRVAVDETGDGAEPASVDLLDVAGERREVAHGPHRLDRAVADEDKRVSRSPRRRGARRREVAPARRPASRAARGRG